MNQAVIWNISNKKDFPIEIWKHPKLNIVLNKLSLSELESIEFLENTINILYIDLTAEELELKMKFINKISISVPEISLILLTGFSPLSLENYEINRTIIFLESPIRKNELRLILDKTIQAEFYKETTLEIGSACLTNVGFFEGLFELANKENKDSRDTLKAFELILDFEKQNKTSKLEINSAIERVQSMKDNEMIQLFDTLKATEKLNELRDSELKEALAIKEATEKALHYSRIEEINMQKIIKAHDKIFEFTDQEIKDLIEENKTLKSKLNELEKIK